MPIVREPSFRPWLTRLFGLATLAYTGLLVYATHHPRPEALLGPNPPSDKTLHFIAYAVLAGLAAATWLTTRRTAGRGMVALTLFLAAFGALDEITQPLFRRHAEPIDWLYDCLGIAIGITVAMALAAVARRIVVRAQ